MGQFYSRDNATSAGRWNPELTPDWFNDPTFPVEYGFEEQGLKRKEREMHATKAEMVSLKMDVKYRDFCAHKYIQFKSCARSQAPYIYKCAPERAEWAHCMEDDYIIGMKDFERERRLKVRKVRKERLLRLKEERLEQLSKFKSNHEHEAEVD